jgi:protein-disulfide isomerase
VSGKDSKGRGDGRPSGGVGRGGGSGRGVVTAARPTQSRRGTLVAAGAVVLVLAVVIGGVLYQRSRTAPVNDGYGSAQSAAVSVSNGVVRVGATDAPVTLDVYEDFLCPICSQFEGLYGQQVAQALDEGKVAVSYHMLDFLNSRSASKDYSSRAAGAAICVASDGTGSAFPAFHTALFATENQPKEGAGDDLSNDQLATLAGTAGASQSAQACIAAGDRTATAQAASKTGQDALQAAVGQVGTPTVLNGGTQVNINDRGWLTSLT